MKNSNLFKVLFIAGLTFIFCGNYLMTDTSIYGTVKILTVTDYYGGYHSSGLVYITQNGSVFIATRLYNGPGWSRCLAHITGNGVDYYAIGDCESESGCASIQLGYLTVGNRADVWVMTDSGTINTYCVADVWQWQQ